MNSMDSECTSRVLLKFPTVLIVIILFVDDEWTMPTNDNDNKMTISRK